MKKRELAALVVLVVILIGFPVAVFGYQRLYVPASLDGVRVIDLVARTPQSGGWSPEVITVNKGDTVRLRITSPDVVHGFAIGKMGVDVGRIVPGKVTTVEFVADEVGRFTFYCNVWCDPNHYRMRGTLEVLDPRDHAVPLDNSEQPAPVPEGLDIDAPHEADFFPLGEPSAQRGRAVAAQIARPQIANLRGHSPGDIYQVVRETTPGDALTEAAIWDLIAFMWSQSTTRSRLDLGAALYAKNCVGCHGATGQGEGPGSQFLDDEMVDFTDARTMAGGTGEIYFAKIRRGGMGTGMPYFGTVFTEEETWALVDYLWTFLLKGYY